MRDQLQAEFQKLYKQFSINKPLYSRINDEYVQNTLIPSLEERKLKLQELRQLYKPKREEIIDHMKKYDETRL